MGESLKQQTVKGLLWSGLEKIAFEAIQFIVGIVLARILTPHDYGTVGLIMVFITISQLFIDGGLTTALIQKKNRTDDDFNTVFIFNFAMSAVLYMILFIIAPLVAKMYNIEELTSLLRLLGLVLIITPFSSIQITQLTIKVDFRTISLVSVPSAIISGAVGIVMAYNGFGPYSIVAQQIIMVLSRSIIVNIISKYHIKLIFSKSSFKDLFSFSYKLVLSSSLDRIYNTVFTMIIGKVFSPTALGLYSRGTQFVSLTSGILGSVFDRVTLPVMSSVQDDKELFKKVFVKYIKGSSFIIFAALIILMCVAKPLILFLLTDKWVEAVPILQLMCVAWMTNHICFINRNVLYIMKRSDLALKLELVKKGTAFLIFLGSLHFGIIGVCVGQAIYGILSTFLNSAYTKKFIDISILQQTRDYGNILIISIISAIVPYFIMGTFESNILQMVSFVTTYAIIYILLNAVLKTEPYTMLKSEIVSHRKHGQ